MAMPPKLSKNFRLLKNLPQRFQILIFWIIFWDEEQHIQLDVFSMFPFKNCVCDNRYNLFPWENWGLFNSDSEGPHLKARLYTSSNQRNISSLISITSSISRSDISLSHYWQQLEEEQELLYLGQIKSCIRSPSRNRFISPLYAGRLQRITKRMDLMDFGAKNHLQWNKREQITFCRFVWSTG